MCWENLGAVHSWETCMWIQDNKTKTIHTSVSRIFSDNIKFKWTAILAPERQNFSECLKYNIYELQNNITFARHISYYDIHDD
jgi:hypothetical protein